MKMNMMLCLFARNFIDLYKADMGITGKKSSKEAQKKVAKSVKVSSKESPEARVETSTFRESENCRKEYNLLNMKLDRKK